MSETIRILGGKTAIVTGASRGIGRAIAIRLAGEGARVVLCARDGAALDGVAEEIREAGGEAMVAALDLRAPEAAGQAVEVAAGTFGRIDILVNNAGATKRGAFESLSEEDWADGFALKFFGAVRLIRCAWPHLRSSGGSVVNIAGIGGRTPGPEFTIGGSVNAALLSLTKALADLGIRDGVQVNTVNPGYVRTARLAARLKSMAAERGIGIEVAEREFLSAAKASRIGQPEDIAALVAYIVSPSGRFLQGSLIDIDGGATKTI